MSTSFSHIFKVAILPAITVINGPDADADALRILSRKRNFNKEVADNFKDPSKEELNTDDSLQTFQRTRTKPRCIIEKSRINLKITLKTFDFKTEDSNASVFLLKKTTMSHQKLNALHPKKYNIYCFHL
jgi:hypothetical protein